MAIVGILHVVVEKMRHDMIEYSGRLSDILETTIQMLVGKELWRSSRGCQKVDGEPLAGVVANDLLRAVKAMLDIQPLNDYPRRPVSRDRLTRISLWVTDREAGRTSPEVHARSQTLTVTKYKPACRPTADSRQSLRPELELCVSNL